MLPSMRDVKFRIRCWRRELGNLNWLGTRGVQGHLVTGKNAGTHWVRYMLSLALAERYGIEPPRYFNTDSTRPFILNHSGGAGVEGMPRLMGSHMIPGAGYGLGAVRPGSMPPVVVIVRDLRVTLIAHYERWKHRYGLSWSQYLRLPPGQEGIHCDLWWHIHFLNRWGDCIARLPQEVTSIRYEDMRKNTAPNIECILRHFDIHMPVETIRNAIAAASLDAVEQETDPDEPECIVRELERNVGNFFSGEDGEFFSEIIARNLRHSFGYNYTQPISVRPRSTTRNSVARSPAM